MSTNTDCYFISVTSVNIGIYYVIRKTRHMRAVCNHIVIPVITVTPNHHLNAERNLLLFTSGVSTTLWV